MTLFWISAAGLIVLAMAFIILPILLRREYKTLSSDELNLSVFKQQLEELDNDLTTGMLDQARYDAARHDLEKELLVDVAGDRIEPADASSQSGKWIMGVSLIIPLAALVLYQLLGSPEVIERLAAGQGSVPTHPREAAKGLPPMEELVRKLAAKLEAQPDNLDGWVMLGRSYMAMNQPTEAITAYERAMQLNAEKPSLLLAYAEAVAQMNGNSFTGKAATLIEKAYSINGQDPNVLWMIGIVAYQRGEYQEALGHWEQLVGMLGPQSKELASVENAISDARAQLGQPELPSIVQASTASSQNQESADSPAIKVRISLSAELSNKAKPDDLVFIYAKALTGPPMPLAAARKRVKDLPLTIELDDSMAMMPQMKLSSFPEVVVGARISLSGNPVAQTGDLEGEVRPVKLGQPEPVLVTIDTIHP